MSKKKIRYFISFKLFTGEMERTMNDYLVRSDPIKDFADISEIEGNLMMAFSTDNPVRVYRVTITSWQRFEDE